MRHTLAALRYVQSDLGGAVSDALLRQCGLSNAFAFDHLHPCGVRGLILLRSVFDSLSSIAS